jgi:hypothetical protein
MKNILPDGLKNPALECIMQLLRLGLHNLAVNWANFLPLVGLGLEPGMLPIEGDMLPIRWRNIAEYNWKQYFIKLALKNGRQRAATLS